MGEMRCTGSRGLSLQCNNSPGSIFVCIERKEKRSGCGDETGAASKPSDCWLV